MAGDEEDRAGSVLIVDDDQEVRETIQDALEMDDHPTAAAADGVQALDWLHQHGPPSVILLDLMMPVMDGWKVLEELREDERLSRVPVVVMTGFGRNLGSASTFPVLRKPFDLNELREVVDRCCGAPA